MMQSFADPSEDPEFMANRLCGDFPPELVSEVFFPERGGRYDRARTICETCTVTEKCLDYYIEIEHGYVGGTTPDERKDLRVRRKKVAS